MICCAQVLLLAPSSYLKRAGREGGRGFSLWGDEDVHRAMLGEDTGTAEETFLWIKGGRIRAPSTDRPPTCSHNPEKSSQLVCIQPAGQRMLGSDVRIYLKTLIHPSVTFTGRFSLQADLQESRCTMHTKYSRVYFSSLIILQRPETYKAYCFVLANPCTPSRPRPLTELWRKQGWDWPEITRCHWDLMHLNANENFKLVPKSRLPPRSLS